MCNAKTKIDTSLSRQRISKTISVMANKALKLTMLAGLEGLREFLQWNSKKRSVAPTFAYMLRKACR